MQYGGKSSAQDGGNTGTAVTPAPGKPRWLSRLVSVLCILVICAALGSLIWPRVKAGFHRAGAMNTPRLPLTATCTVIRGHFAAKGFGEFVLVIGGEDTQGKPLSSWEIYDPRTNTFEKGGDLPRPRAGHTATLLRDGRVFIAGGWDGRAYVEECAILDPRTGEIQEGPKFRYPRRGAVSAYIGGPATIMPRYDAVSGLSARGPGKVLIAGGASAECGVEYYDEATRTMGYFPAPGATLTGATLTRHSGSGALLAGGRRPDGTVNREAWIVDGVGLKVRAAGSPAEPRFDHCALERPGEVLLIGGVGADGRALRSTEVFGQGGGFARGPELLRPVSAGSVCWYGDQYSRMGSMNPPPWRVLLLGGADGNPSAHTQILEYPYRAWKEGPLLRTARYGATPASIRGVQSDAWHVVVMGGKTRGGNTTAGCEWSEYSYDERPNWFMRLMDRMEDYLP